MYSLVKSVSCSAKRNTQEGGRYVLGVCVVRSVRLRMWCLRVWCETWDFPEQIRRPSESRPSFFLAVGALQCWPRRASRMPRQESMEQSLYAAIHVTFVNPIHHSAPKCTHELCCPAYPNLTMTLKSLQTSQKHRYPKSINSVKQLGTGCSGRKSPIAISTLSRSDESLKNERLEEHNKTCFFRQVTT